MIQTAKQSKSWIRNFIRKKVIFIFAIIGLSSNLYSQSQDPTLLYSPDGIFDRVFDNAGNTFELSEIEAGKSTRGKKGTIVTNNLLCTSGIFELYFETGSGMENVGNSLHNQRRAIICQVFTDMSNFINTPLKNSGNATKVKIWIRNPNNVVFNNNTFTRGTTYYNTPSLNYINNVQVGGIVDGEVWKTIQSGVDSYKNTLFPIASSENGNGFYHGYMSFKFNDLSINWNYDYNKFNVGTGFPTNSKDFYSQVLLELTHTLGLNSLIDHNGGSIISWSTLSTLYAYYSRYDTFLKTPGNFSTSLIINNSATNGQMYNYAGNTSGSLHPSCFVYPPVSNFNSNYLNCATSINFTSPNITLPVYTPGCYEKLLSFSHFEDACYNGNTDNQYFLMSNQHSINLAKRFLQAEERQVLCNIGYSLNNTFGNTSNFTFKNYNTSICTGLGVAGVNDGFLSSGLYAFEGDSGTEISISGILNNDYTSGSIANLRYEFVQDLSDPNALITNIFGNNSTVITLKSSVPGVHLLRYVPFDTITQKRGNITYIYVNVKNNCNIVSNCNFVTNGDFEEHTPAIYYSSQIQVACGWSYGSGRGTADYFNHDSISETTAVPCNVFGYQEDKIEYNNGYAGMAISPYLSESIKTKLSNFLLPNTNYKLTFDVSLAESSKTSAKLQAFLSNTDLHLVNNGTIPATDINSSSILLTNNTYSTRSAAASDGWETITFYFNTGSNSNLRFLYLGGLSDIVLQNEEPIINPCNGSMGYSTSAYYYIDNVALTPSSYVATNIQANDDNFVSMPISATDGGTTISVYSNDLYNGLPSSGTDILNVSFSLMNPLAISGATINNLGLITVPANTPIGTHILTYKVETSGACPSIDYATVTIFVDDFTITPNLSNAIRANNVVKLAEFQKPGKIIIAGSFTQYNNIARNNIARLNTDLTLDWSFYSAGPSPSSFPPTDMAVQQDGKIIVVGAFAGFSGGSHGTGIARLLPNGAIDTNFNSGGIGIEGNVGYTNKHNYTCAIQDDGKILIGGDFWSYNGIKRLGIVRLNSNGGIDNTFNPIDLNNNYYRSVITKIVVQPDGKILISGNFSSAIAGVSYKNLIRLNPNGQIDQSLAMGDLAGSSIHSDLIGALYSPIGNMTMLSNGKILLSGAFDKYNDTNVHNLVQIMPNGIVDQNFNYSAGVNRGIYSVVEEPSSNKLLIAGDFDTYNEQAVKKLIRLNSDGGLDSTFSIGTGTLDPFSSTCDYCHYVRIIKKQPDGKIIVGGKFTMFNGLQAGYITRIYGDSGVQARNNGIEYISEAEIDVNIENKVIVYPNPSKGNFIFDLTQDKNNYNILEIYNLLGVKVFTTSISPQEVNSINLSALANGYYLARLENQERTTIIKLIKN